MKNQPSCRLSVALATICLLAQLPLFGSLAHADVVSTTTNNGSSSATLKGSKSSSVETREPIANTSAAEDDDAPGKFSGTYFGIFYGPNIAKPSSLQSNSDGVPESDKPVMMKNF